MRTLGACTATEKSNFPSCGTQFIPVAGSLGLRPQMIASLSETLDEKAPEKVTRAYYAGSRAGFAGDCCGRQQSGETGLQESSLR